MAYTYDPGYVEQMKEMLMAVSRTNLMAPSKEEFGRLIDRDLSKNSASKLKTLSDFSVCAIFHQLRDIVERETKGLLDLEGLLLRYERTYIYYKEHMQNFLRSRQKEIMPKLYAMLDYIILTDTTLDDTRDTSWDDQWYEALINRADLRIVALLAMGVLSAYGGKGNAAASPLEITRSFIMDYVTREDCILRANTEYYQMLVTMPYNLDDRIASVALLFRFCQLARLAFSIDFSRVITANSKEIVGLDTNYVPMEEVQNQSPVLWWNEKVEHEFWYFEFVGNAYFMTKCDFARKTYTKYTLFTGSELEGNIGKIVHPKCIATAVEGDFTAYWTVASWSAEYDKKGTTKTVSINLMKPPSVRDDWAKEFRGLHLQRMSSDHPHYSTFARSFKRTDDAWRLNDNYSNAFPGTSYLMGYSLYSVALDHILVQDIKPNPEKPSNVTLIDDKYFKVDRKWVDEDVQLGDGIGILLLGTDEPDKPLRKYLALDYNCTYYPIVNDEIQFPT